MLEIDRRGLPAVAAELIAGLGDATAVTVRADASPAAMERWRAALAGTGGVEAVQPEEYGATVTCTHASSTVAAAFAAADREDVVIGGVEVVSPDLEAVFLKLSGRALRDPSLAPLRRRRPPTAPWRPQAWAGRQFSSAASTSGAGCGTGRS